MTTSFYTDYLTDEFSMLTLKAQPRPDDPEPPRTMRNDPPAVSSAAAAVHNGIAALDAYYGPEWVQRVNVHLLSLNSGSDCLLGQLEGGYSKARDKFWGGGWHADKMVVGLGFESADALGYVASTDVTARWTRHDLWWLWVDYISQKQKARPPKAEPRARLYEEQIVWGPVDWSPYFTETSLVKA